ncbi:ribonuclease H-like domain-containing protein [Xylaria cf. heliscus]|nr:ribonuclease H-like domain-containing protein [Xylaria cf. heliscus]
MVFFVVVVIGAVCFDHFRQVCGTCCVDYRGTRRRPNVVVDDDYDDDDDDDGDERVCILETGQNRFIPQWDGQLLGPANICGIETNYADPPKALTPDQLNMHYCGECQLTWMEGDVGAEAVRSHPSHHTYQHIHAGTNRSLVVFTDGACSSNGSSSAVKASIGVYFGPQPRYNISRLRNGNGIPTNQVAEIAAARSALRQVRQNIEPIRRVLIQTLFPQAEEDQVRDIKRFCLIVATDSSCVVECMSKHIAKWSLVDGIYMNRQGHVIRNGHVFAKLADEVQELSMVGVQVAWYHVPREFNQEADRLARLALRS